MDQTATPQWGHDMAVWKGESDVNDLIPELVRDGETGVLVPPEDPRSLAEAIERLARDPALRERLGLAAEEDVRTRFSADPGLDMLAERFKAVL